MMRAGAKRLTSHVEKVNALNVFPVPDGDTGTNMNLTITSGVAEMEKRASETTVGKLAEALSKGLLMGARGNSGVILSQLFRGFAKAVLDKEVLNARQFADAFQQGVETAYKAVMKPVEGTILTVAREAADAGMKRSWSTEDPVVVLTAVLDEAKRTLARTPDMLPVLKQTGVVDAGGQGLVYVYEGMLSVMTGEQEMEVEFDVPTPAMTSLDELAEVAHAHNAQSMIDPAEIEYGYCTEFIVKLNIDRRPTEKFDETRFRQDISRFGDSLLVVADDDLVKIHIHAEYPGDAMTYAQKYGDLIRIKIENMREQYENVTSSPKPVAEVVPDELEPEKEFGIVAVATGDGIAKIFTSVGVDQVIEGGQSMNPSTEDIVKAIEKVHAKHVIVLPNNKNIILAAEQAQELVEKDVTVIPTKTIPQGLAALLAFEESYTADKNENKMKEAIASIQSGEVTFAVRDTNIDGLEIQKDDFLGIREGKIVLTGTDMLDTSYQLVEKMAEDGAEILTILYGAEVTEDQVNDLTNRLENRFPELECEVYYGGQPLYYFLFSVE
nr:DAK2 domain-containing protein [Risungbinella massiliensis]